jgi:iron(III) transport system permease protein
MPRIATCFWLLLAGFTTLAVVTLWHTDPRVGRLWLNTAWLAAAASLMAVPVGTFAAVAIFKTDVPGRRAAALVFTAILFVPLYMVTGAWDAGFGIQGWHTLATNPHLAQDPWLAGWRAAIWVHAFAAVPWVVLIVGTGLRAIDAEIEDDAATCASPASVIWNISLPLSAPVIMVACTWVAIVASSEISVTDFFQVRTFAEEVYTQSALGLLDLSGEQGAGSRDLSTFPAPDSALPALSAAGLSSGLLLSTGLALVAILAAARLFWQLGSAPHRRRWTWRLGRWRWLAALGLWSIVLLVAGLPLGNLIYKAGVLVTTTDGVRVRSWSPAKVVERVVAAPVEFSGELWLSVWIGAAAATAALGIALPLAWSMRSAPGRIPRVPWLRLIGVAMCLTIPGPLLGVGLIHLLNRPPDSPLSVLAVLYDSNFAPWLVQTIRCVPLVTLIMWPALSSIPSETVDAATMDGAGWWGRLVRIALPQRWAAIAAAWLVGWAIAIGELAATVLVIPPQSYTTISVRVFQLLHYGVDDRVAAICLVMVAGIAMLTGIAGALFKRKM